MEYPARKTVRLREYDYSRPGYYFVTICTHKKMCLFGRIHNGVLCPTRLGLIAREELRQIENRRAYVKVEKWAVMPNHIHMILRISERPRRDMTCHVRNRFSCPEEGSLWTIIAAYKAAVTRRWRNEADMTSHVPTEEPSPVWQGRYYEHIISTDREYREAWRYIDENPRRWGEDAYRV